MLNWRCATGAGGARRFRCGLDELLILLLAMGVMDTAGASSKSALQQQLIQFHKGSDRCARSAKAHTRAGGSVKHPGGHDNDDAGVDLKVDNLASCTLLAVLASHTTAVQRVPAVMDFDLLPDMGRMTP